ncbi:MAG: PIG-L family deacetylase [Muribaculaceae bacterium]|nr:PIG-L family deacetylase [Muribaculaceae bacterium]
MKKILIISPHGDDEILGCGGYMLRAVSEGAQVRVLYGTIGGDDCRQDYAMRLAETEAVARELGFTFGVIKENHDAILDLVPAREIITRIDHEIADFEPDEVFVNYPSLHQDHIHLYQCANTAMRLKEGYMPPFFALYEYPFINSTDKLNGGMMYFDISDVIERKIELFHLYKSQVKESPSPLNATGIRSLAAMRGLECGCAFAEKFYIQRVIKR